jgi:hypothetical protein
MMRQLCAGPFCHSNGYACALLLLHYAQLGAPAVQSCSVYLQAVGLHRWLLCVPTLAMCQTVLEGWHLPTLGDQTMTVA